MFETSSNCHHHTQNIWQKEEKKTDLTQTEAIIIMYAFPVTYRYRGNKRQKLAGLAANVRVQCYTSPTVRKCRGNRYGGRHPTIPIMNPASSNTGKASRSLQRVAFQIVENTHTDTHAANTLLCTQIIIPCISNLKAVLQKIVLECTH